MSKASLSFAVLLVLSLTACYVYTQTPTVHGEPGKPTPTTQNIPADVMARSQQADFAAGCFWGSEATFRAIPGVLTTEVGFEGGTTANPTYEEVCTDKTGYAETVRVTFDPKQVTYQQLLNTFYENHDPTTVDRQGPDYGTQYRSAVFYHSPRTEENRRSREGKARQERRLRRSDRDPDFTCQELFPSRRISSGVFRKSRRALHLSLGQREKIIGEVIFDQRANDL